MTTKVTKESAAFEAFANALAGATGGVAAFTLIYPLDIVRCRLQAEADDPQSASRHSPSSSSPSISDERSPDPNLEEEEIEDESKFNFRKTLNPRSRSNSSSPNARSKSRSKSKLRNRKDSSFESTIRLIYSTEGIPGFYKALGSALVGIFYSEWIYFFAVTFVKYSMYGKREVRPSQNLLSSIIGGLCCALTTHPYWTAQTQMMLQSKKKSKIDQQLVNQMIKKPTKGRDLSDCPSDDEDELRYKHILHAMQCIVARKGVDGLYAGLGPALLLISNPIIQYVCYEEFVNVLKQLRNTSQLSSLTYFMCGALAKAIATYVTYPLQVMKTQLQKRDSKYEGIADYWKFMAQKMKKGDIAPLYAGLYAKLFQTVSNAAIKFMIYEKILGLVKSVIRYLRKLLSAFVFMMFASRPKSSVETITKQVLKMT